MATRTAAVVRAVEVKEIRVSDKLVTDLMGLEGKILIPRGTTISAREVTWLTKKLKETKPRLASQKYRTKTKAMADIKAADGTVLVKRGIEITEEALAPLLKEGFTAQETFESEQKMYYKATEWKGHFHIDQFNPAVQVERLEFINDDAPPAKTPVVSGK